MVDQLGKQREHKRTTGETSPAILQALEEESSCGRDAAKLDAVNTKRHQQQPIVRRLDVLSTFQGIAFGAVHVDSKC